MENAVTQIFVYGSLRSGFKHPAYDYVSKYFTFISNAKVRGCLYDMGSFPAALPCEDDSFIIGELYDLKEDADFSWAIEQLDEYEGVNPEEGETAMYRRDVTEVFYNDTSTTAYIYWFNGDVTGNPIIASGDVLQFIQQKSKL
ncbi:gamma-glutamylcyclotransferase family protein [Aridibaculum aurantiacum]|uniref:gamma-glutamylcyclotransferase family protein n=1 Tax=Aridibaculum aurantiacum TaxID=2810307 RepID=UPI001A95D5A1|nr:gamma-glutamylcyclotransferase family protein [Aridibaculum aurantiacum]